ncbi:MAG: hypothetical protein ACLUNV_08195 [Sutterella wadsworthensis]
MSDALLHTISNVLVLVLTAGIAGLPPKRASWTTRAASRRRRS